MSDAEPLRSLARATWGENYTETMDAEITILERGGCTLADAREALDSLDRHHPRDEWAYFRTVLLARAAERLTIRRSVEREAVDAPS